jgi:hypothetical protein
MGTYPNQNSLSHGKSMIIKPRNNPEVNHQRRGRNQHSKAMASLQDKNIFPECGFNII